MKLLEEVKNILDKEKYYSNDGYLLKGKIIEETLNLNSNLIKSLKENKNTKGHFFIKLEDETLIFDKDKFINFIKNKEFLSNSYTAYSNKIGLTNLKGDFLNNKNDVVLSWAYKDCYLEGGQTKEEQEKEEVFYNNILAPDEIDRLIDDKVLTNFKRFNKDGEQEVGELTLNDNLIIKGNNLLAMHTLEEKYRGQVQTIYSDVPYNTGEDSFKYNDKFNHSTWLTFMKSRLEIAKKLLRPDGTIFIHIDKNEEAYLKVLMDEIFGRNNYIETIPVRSNPRGRDYGGIANTHDYILVYAKSENYKLYRIEDKEKEFQYTDSYGGFDKRELRNRNVKFNDKNRPNLFYPFYLNPKNQTENGFYEIALEPKEGWIKVTPKKSQGIQTVWRWGKEKAKKNLNINITGYKTRNGYYRIEEKYRDNTQMARSMWFDKEVNTERGTLHLKKLFGEKIFDYPKSEGLLRRVIEIGSREGDIVLDFCLGSGTTTAVAHKMKRKYIGIEQMDYIENIPVERLKMVIGEENENGELEYDKDGITEMVGWEGEGEFVYCELMKWNELFIEQIQTASDTNDLLDVYKNIKQKAFLNYKFDIEEFEKENMEDFKKLELAEQKKILINCLDLNQLYVNLSEIEDSEYNISDNDKKLNKSFYEGDTNGRS